MQSDQKNDTSPLLRDAIPLDRYGHRHITQNERFLSCDTVIIGVRNVRNMSIQSGTFRIGYFTIFDWNVGSLWTEFPHMSHTMPPPIYIHFVHIVHLLAFDLFNDTNINFGRIASNKHCKRSS
jgi:hypothetical protein